MLESGSHDEIIPVFKQFFDYYGGLLSYALQFIPIIMLGTYDSKTPADLAQIISNNAFVYIYLVNSFTRLTDLAMDAGEMAGVFQRYVFDSGRIDGSEDSVNPIKISTNTFDFLDSVNVSE